MRLRYLAMLCSLLIASAVSLYAQEMPSPQTSDTLPQSSTSSSGDEKAVTLPEALKSRPVRSAPKYDPTNGYFYDAGVFCGTGSSTSSVATKPTIGCGAGLTFVPLPIFVEVGLMGPQANRSYLTGYVSVDGTVPLYRGKSFYVPAAIFGYSRLFETGHALDYGLALYAPRFGKHKDSTKHLRLELRDYWTFANPSQHNIMLRIGWMEEVFD